MRATLIVLVAALALAGCAPTPAASPPPTSAESETPTPEPTSDPAEGALYELHATFTAEDGSTITIVQSVYRPVTEAELEPSELAALDAECTIEGVSWRDSFPDAEFIRSTFSSSLEGAASWPDDARFIIELGSAPAFTGDIQTFQASCAGSLLDIPGSGTGLTPVSATATCCDVSWQTMRAGVGFIGSGTFGDETPPIVSLESCDIILSEDAAADPATASWPYQSKEFGGSCMTLPPL